MKIGTEHGLQPDSLKRETEHSVINKTNFADLGHIWEPYLKLDVLCLGSLYARHSMKMQIKTGFGFKDCLTEANLGWKCFVNYKKIENFLRLTINMLEML